MTHAKATPYHCSTHIAILLGAFIAAGGMVKSNVVEVKDLRKTYQDGGLMRKKDIHALNGVTFDVQPGEVFGLLGPNGAGKTTFIKVLLGIIQKSGGEAKLLGFPAGDRRGRLRVGYLPERLVVPRHHTGRTALEYYGQLSGMTKAQVLARRESVLELVGLAERGDDWARKYSKGMLQRLGLAQALIHDPELLILDEPTDGLDPVGRAQVRAILARLRGEGKTIFLNSHLLQEVELICDRVAIMDRGRILCEGSPEALKRALHTGERVELEIDGRLADADGEALCALGAVNLRTDSGRGIEFQARPGEGVGRRAAQLLEGKGYRIRHLTIAPVSLEDVFFSHTGRALRDA